MPTKTSFTKQPDMKQVFRHAGHTDLSCLAIGYPSFYSLVF